MFRDYADEPLGYRPRTPRKRVNEPWLSVNDYQKIGVFGQTRSGKSVVIDYIVNEFYRAGIFIAHIFSAGGFENLYYAINKDCGKRVQAKQETNPDFYIDNIPTCQCSKTYPVLWMVPNYCEVDKKSLDRFNSQLWSGIDEYRQYLLEISTEDKRKLIDGVLKKPFQFALKELIKVAYYTPPTDTAERKIEQFASEFEPIVKQAKKEHRILVHSPQIYPNTPQGKREKYGTTSEILRNLQALSQTELFSKYHSDMPRNQWSVWQKSQHKIGIITNEVRAMAPSGKLSGDKESGVSKRSFYNYLPEARHNKSWIVFDLQSVSDMHEGSKKQVDIRIVKRSTPMLLGEDLGWLKTSVDRRIKFLAEQEGFLDIERLPEFFKETLLNRYHLARVEEIPDNFAYVVYENGEYKLISLSTPPWHHKSDKDNFQEDTGIQWTFKDQKIIKETATVEYSVKTNKKSEKNAVMQQVDHYVKVGMKFPVILEKMQELEKSNTNPYTGMDKLSGNTLGNKYRRWLKKQSK